jgi:hypothetical protein
MVETLGRGLVEVVRDPGRDHYRYVVEMRHDIDGMGSWVGIYFGYQEEGNHPDSRKGTFYTWTFADKGPGARAEQDADGNPVSRPMLDGHCFAEDLQRRGVLSYTRIARGQPFRPVRGAGKPGPWRTLVLEIHPGGIVARWTADDGTRQSAAEVSAEELRDRLQEHVNAFNPAGEVVPAFNPRSGLGLFVLGGKASIRRIVVEPLTDGAARHP